MAFPDYAVNSHDFTGSDADPIGAPWIALGTNAMPKRASNRLEASVSGGDAIYGSTIHGHDVHVYATVAAKPAANKGMSILTRIHSPGSAKWNGYTLYIKSLAGTDTMRFFRGVDGSFATGLGAGNTSAEFSAGDLIGVAIEGVGATVTLRCYQKIGAGAWTEVFNVTDTSASRIIPAGFIGLGVDSGGAGAWDNLFFGGSDTLLTPASLPLADSFTGSDAAPLPAPWSTPIVSGQTGLRRVSNQAGPSTTGQGSSHKSDVSAGDAGIRAKVTARPTTGKFLVLWGRVHDPNSGSLDAYNGAIVAKDNAVEADYWSMNKSEAGVSTAILASTHAAVVAANDEVAFTAQGTSPVRLMLWHKSGTLPWCPVALYDDASPSAQLQGAGTWGFESNDNAGDLLRLDDAYIGSLTPSYSLANVAEADSARPLSAAKRYSIGPATSTDSARPLDVDKHVTIGRVFETDAAQQASHGTPISKTLGIATSTNAAQALTSKKTIGKTIGPAASTNVAQPLVTSKNVVVSVSGGPTLFGVVTAITPPGATPGIVVHGFGPSLLLTFGELVTPPTPTPTPIIAPRLRIPPPVIWLLDEARNTIAELEAYDSCQWTRRYYQLGEFELSIGRRVAGAALIAPGRYIRIDDDPEFGPPLVYRIGQARFVMDEQGRPSDTISAKGFDYGMLRDRKCLPPPFTLPPTAVYHEIQGAAETAMKQFVDMNAGPGAQPERRVPDLLIEPDQARGANAIWQARLQGLHERLEQVSRAAEIGWEVIYRLGDDKFIFTVKDGEDLTDSVVIDVEFDSAQAQEWLRDEETSKTLLYVGGQGIGAGRVIVAAFVGDDAPDPVQPSGLARREEFVDAADVADSGQLAQRGREELANWVQTETVDAKIAQFGPFQYLRHWDLGNVVLIRNTEWGVMRPARIVETRRSHRPQPGVTETEVTFDKERPSLAAAIEKRVKKAAAVLA